MHILIYGNPHSGFEYVGPFQSRESAQNWADKNTIGPDWWLVKLQTPAEAAQLFSIQMLA